LCAKPNEGLSGLLAIDVSLVNFTGLSRRAFAIVGVKNDSGRGVIRGRQKLFQRTISR